MKILHIMAGGAFGGAETAFVDMCLAMHEAGENVEVATRANAVRVPRLKEAGIKVHTLPFGGKVDIYTPWALRRIVKDFKPDIVQSWMSRAASKMPRWSASMNIPRYLHVARLGTPYKLKYFKNVDYFVSITPDILTYLVENGVNKGHVRQINNFAEVEPAPVPLRRSDFDTPEDAPLILGMGRLHPDKAFDTLIKVAATMPDVYVWIAGEGSQRAELEAMISDLNLEERVKLLGWRTDRAALLQAVDICAFISRDEGFGTVFVQCWAQKTPVVVCNSDGPRQFVRHEEDGLMTVMDDVADISAALQRLIDDPALANKLTTQGFARYEDEFTKGACLQGYLEYYHYIREKEHL